MNKKIIYSLVLTSLFIISMAAVCVQPVVGDTHWKFGVPDAAKGMKLQSEVKIYDKETWGECIGTSLDDRAAQAFGNYREGYSPDGDNVGARSQSEIQDWESGDYWFMGDSLLWTKLDESIRMDASYDRDGDGVGELQYYWDAIEFAEKTVAGFANRTDLVGTGYSSPLIKYVLNLAAMLNGINPALFSTANLGLINDVQTLALASSYSKTEVAAMFHKTYEAKVVERDVWYWDKDVDFDSDPDQEGDEAPFIKEPEDLEDSFYYFFGFTETLFAQITTIINAYTTVLGPTNVGSIMTGHTHGDGSNWDNLNTTLWTYLVPGLPAQVQYVITTLCMNDAVLGLYQFTKASFQGIIDFFRGKIPDKAEYLMLLLTSGIPAHQPVDKWLSDLIDAFDIDPDVLWNLPSYDKFYVDISVDGLVVTIEKEWYEGTLVIESDPLSGEREDFDIVITYGDTGGVSSIEYKKGNTVFYQNVGIAPTIPGFEISILLAAAAISAIGLIFVVMKRRK